jgi:DNA-binding transcriptional LysR family regulator
VTLDEFARLGHVLVASPSGGMGPVDYALAKRGRNRHIAAYVPHFLVAPSLVASTDLVLTTGRRIADRLAPMLGLEVFPCPVPLKPFAVQTVWHPRTEDDSVGVWLRALLREAAAKLLQRERGGGRRPNRRRSASAPLQV